METWGEPSREHLAVGSSTGVDEGFLCCPRELQRWRKLKFMLNLLTSVKIQMRVGSTDGKSDALFFATLPKKKNPSVRSAFEWCEITVCSTEIASFVAHETCKVKIPWKKTFVRREAAEAPGGNPRSALSPAFSKNTPTGCKESVTHQETLFVSLKLLINIHFFLHKDECVECEGGDLQPQQQINRGSHVVCCRSPRHCREFSLSWSQQDGNK